MTIKDLSHMTCAIWIYFSCSLIFLYFSRLKARKILRKNLGTRKIYLILHSYPYDNYYLFKKQGESMIDTYKREVGACENIIMVQKDNESKLINGIKKIKRKRKITSKEKT